MGCTHTSRCRGSGFNRTEIRYVIQRDIPDKPAFVVIYSNYYDKDERLLANKVEEILIALGQKIVLPPTIIETETEKGVSSKTSDQRVKERYSKLGDVKADYIIQIDSDSWSSCRVKIVKNETDEILATFNDKEVCIEDNLEKSLVAMGIKVRTENPE